MTQAQKIEAAEFYDPTFAEGGVLGLPFEGIEGSIPNSVVALPQNKLLLLFSGSLAENFPVKVARLNEDGTLDVSFGTRGFVEIPFEDGASFRARHLHLLENGGWLITGTVERLDETVDLAVVRQLPDGQLDTSFGTGGKATVNIYELIDSLAEPNARFLTRRHDEKNAEKPSVSAGDVGIAAVGQQDGKIVLVSTVFFAFDYLRGIAVRLNADGSLDTTFNEKGFVLVELPGITHRWNYAAGVAVQQDGKVLVCGDFSRESSDESPDAYIIRYDESGNVDESYGDNKNGVVTITDSSRWLELGSMTLKSDGGVVAVGIADGTRRHGLIVSLNPTGSFNLVFNKGKPLFSDIPGFAGDGVSWRRCVVQTDGKLVVSGQGGGLIVDESTLIVTARYLSDGTLDGAFAGKGWDLFSDDRGFDFFRGCTVMADNRVVVCGYVTHGPLPLPGNVVRYLA